MKMKKYIYPVLILLAMLLPIGCADAEMQLQQSEDNDTEKVNLRIRVTLPDAQTAGTRAFNNQNFQFEDLDVAVFVKQGNMYILQEFVHAEKPTSTWDSDEEHWTFNVKLSKNEGEFRLHFIANYPELTMGLGEESGLIGRLLADASIAEHDVYWNYVNVINIDENTQLFLQNIPLVRNFAKIEVKLEPKEGVNLNGKFQLLEYAIHNVPQRGTVAPYNSTNGSFANYVSKDAQGNVHQHTYDELTGEQGYTGNEPYNNALTYLTDFQSVSTPFYLYERTHVNVDNPTCVIIKGKYASDGEFDDVDETYYKLDFIYRDTETNTNVYYNLLRNFIYTMNIVDVTGEGYKSAELAINNPASNNISGNANIDDFTNISDGEGRLFVSATYLVFTDEEPIDIYYQYIPDITQSNVKNNKLKGNGDGEIVVNAKAGNVLVKDAVIASTDESTGHVGWRKITLTPKSPPTDDPYYVYTQDITIASNNLQRKITLVMRNPYEMNVRVVNPENKLVPKKMKSQVDVKVTIPGGMPMALFPLKFYLTSEMNSIYAKPGTDMYSESFEGGYGFVKEISWDFYSNANATGIDATGDPVGIKETDGKISFICNFWTNCNESATNVYVYNEHFARGSDSFGNPWKNEVKMDPSTEVEIRKIYGRNPQIIDNNGKNTGTESVRVTLNGSYVGTITIDYNNVTSGITFTNTNGLSPNDVVEFTFTDSYWHGRWSETPITYKAVSTLGEIDAGTTLVFEAQGEINKLTRLEVTTSQTVSVPKSGNGTGRHPQKIYKGGSEEVTVTMMYNDEAIPVGIIYINGSNVTAEAVLEYSSGFNLENQLKFTFSDMYADKNKDWKGPAVYTATCTVEQLMNGSVTLSFAVNN